MNNKLALLPTVIAIIFPNNIFASSQLVENHFSQNLTEPKNHINKKIIEISPADINGISSNFHEYFNMDKQGIKINNDVKKPVKITINQVISCEKSIIKGNIEILGNTKPHFIIENPNDIDCSDHCSISNANTATLTTNKIITNNDMLSDQSINNTKRQIYFKNITQDKFTNAATLELVAKSIKLESSQLNVNDIEISVSINHPGNLGD
ncbi:MAG TPA: hypothetical protein ACHBX0_12215 [Arsenophonus sp.]